ncbi:sigma-70 family RNA polymerase sigma factor [Faecalimicrobium sp. JNUCC 81]
MEDIVTVKRAIKGDREAFEQLIGVHMNYLYREAYLRTKYEDDAKEVVQETVYKAFRGIEKLRQPEYFKTWITRILINVSNDFLSKNGIIDLEHDEEAFIKEVVVDDQREIKIDLYNAIDELEDKYKDAIILRYIHDMKVEEVANILNRPVNTIKTHIRKAISDMKNLLREGYKND